MKNIEVDLKAMRKSYERSHLLLEHLTDDPQDLMKQWLQAAIEAPEVAEANTFYLATVDEKGQPTVRTILLKGLEMGGLVFYSNYNSRKGREIEQNPKAAILFFWQDLQRQVRIEGKIQKIDPNVSTQYFQSRPRGSQIGAWASPQSQVIPDRDILDNRVHEIETQYQNLEHLPKPPHWGGYILMPHYYEFWQGRANRLHDRFAYTKSGDQWKIERLAP